MSNLQKEGAGYASIGRHYRKVAAIFDKLPPRFKFMDAMRLAGKQGASHG